MNAPIYARLNASSASPLLKAITHSRMSHHHHVARTMIAHEPLAEAEAVDAAEMAEAEAEVAEADAQVGMDAAEAVADAHQVAPTVNGNALATGANYRLRHRF